jgi:hypothetical protein
MSRVGENFDLRWGFKVGYVAKVVAASLVLVKTTVFPLTTIVQTLPERVTVVATVCLLHFFQ